MGKDKGPLARTSLHKIALQDFVTQERPEIFYVDLHAGTHSANFTTENLKDKFSLKDCDDCELVGHLLVQQEFGHRTF